MEKKPLMKTLTRIMGLVLAMSMSMGQLQAADLPLVVHTAGHENEAASQFGTPTTISVVLIDPQTGMGIDLGDTGFTLPSGWALDFYKVPPGDTCDKAINQFTDSGNGTYEIDVECTDVNDWAFGEYHYSITIEAFDIDGNLRKGTALGVLNIHTTGLL